MLFRAPEEKFGGTAAKQTADEIIDLFCDFLSENGDQEQVMGNITVKFSAILRSQGKDNC